MIWRFDLPLTDRLVLTAPAGVRLLRGVVPSDRVPHGVTVWGVVDPSQPSVEHTLTVVGTGTGDPVTGRHVGTVSMGGFVWHVFTPTPLHT